MQSEFDPRSVQGEYLRATGMRAQLVAAVQAMWDDVRVVYLREQQKANLDESVDSTDKRIKAAKFLVMVCGPLAPPEKGHSMQGLTEAAQRAIIRYGLGEPMTKEETREVENPFNG